MDVVKNMKEYIPYQQFFQHFPIDRNEVIYVSSDLRKLIYQAKKHKEIFDLTSFLDGLKQKISENGTIIIPTFNYQIKSGDTFDVRKTMPITGTLSVEAMQDQSFKRTGNPMHSVAVWGKYQKEYLKLSNKSSFGTDSVFQLMYEQGAKLLAIDVDLQQSLTFAHYAEEAANVSYRYSKTYWVNYLDETGHLSKKEFSIFSKKPGYINQVNPLWNDFKQAGAVQELTINQVSCFVLDLRKAYDIMMADLKENHARKMTYFSWENYFKGIIKKMIGKA